MRYGSKDVSFFLISGQDVCGTLTEFEDKREAKIERSDGLGDSWEEHTFAGVRTVEITQQGFYEDAVGSLHDALSSGPGATNALAYCIEGTATGAQFVAWSNGVQVNYQRQAERDGLVKAQAVYRNGRDGIVEQGLVLHTYKAVGTTGKKGVVDLGDTSTGLAGYLHYNASAGEANVRILHSANASDWTDLIVFSRISSGHGAQRIYASGDVNRYVCADFTTATATGAIGALRAFVGVVP